MILYHHSLSKNRDSILLHGLQGKYDQTVDMNDPMVIGGIFLTDKKTPSACCDVWEVNAEGFQIENDWTSTPEDPKENWYVIYADIPPEKLKLAR